MWGFSHQFLPYWIISICCPYEHLLATSITSSGVPTLRSLLHFPLTPFSFWNNMLARNARKPHCSNPRLHPSCVFVLFFISKCPSSTQSDVLMHCAAFYGPLRCRCVCQTCPHSSCKQIIVVRNNSYTITAAPHSSSTMVTITLVCVHGCSLRCEAFESFVRSISSLVSSQFT